MQFDEVFRLPDFRFDCLQPGGLRIHRSNPRRHFVHRNSQLSVFTPQFVNDPRRFVLPSRRQAGFQRKFLQTLKFLNILRTAHLERHIGDGTGNRVQSPDFAGRLVHGQPEVAIPGREFSNQRFRILLLTDGESGFHR